MGDRKKLITCLANATFLTGGVELSQISSDRYSTLRSVERHVEKETVYINQVKCLGLSRSSASASTSFGSMKLLQTLCLQLCEMNALPLHPQRDVFDVIVLRMSRHIAAADAYQKLKRILRTSNLSLVRVEDTHGTSSNNNDGRDKSVSPTKQSKMRRGPQPGGGRMGPQPGGGGSGTPTSTALVKRDESLAKKVLVKPITVSVFESNGQLHATISTSSTFGLIRNDQMISGFHDINSHGFLVHSGKVEKVSSPVGNMGGGGGSGAGARMVEPWVKFAVIVEERINLSTGDFVRLAKIAV
jgi:hypothetical protein